jgi:hypothetical protein
MLSRLVPFWFALMLGPTIALGDARRDCARASGDAAIAACSQVIQQNPGDSGAYYDRGNAYQTTCQAMGISETAPASR